MMKQVKFKSALRAFALMATLLLTATAFAQQMVVKGNVKDETGEPVMGATVRVVGQPGGALTDIDGNFSVQANSGATLEISYIGYQKLTATAQQNMLLQLKPDNQTLGEVVVIGYGVAKKSDLTGSVTALKPDTKNKGLVVNAQDMMQGKIAGVTVTSGGGTPGGGSTIRIRGGSSLNASNDPLIVIDGVAMDNNGVKGLANPLSMVNPQDIESFNVLKDASATAIYGSRGSNGVIIITTKKGRKGQAPSVSYAGSATVSMKQKTYDVMTGDEFRTYVKNMYGADSEEAALLGSANTDWQEEIYRTAISHDHNVTVAGSVGKVLPYRVSVGYTNQQGIIKTSDFERYTAALNLNPSFLEDHLTLNLNAKGMWAKSQYADGAAISAALYMDPTQPVKSSDSKFSNFGGYWQWTTSGSSLNDSSWPYTYNTNATKNPVSILDLKDDHAISRAFIGNADIDYKVHGFEDLRLHATLGADVSKGKQTTNVEASSPLSMYYGSFGSDEILKRNLSLNAYAQYYHDFNDAAQNHIDVMGGYEWQHFWRSQHNDYVGYYQSTNNDPTLAGTERPHTPYTYKTENYLVSFFGRLNYSLMDRYLFTATVRHDGSSRFKEHWSTFPSFAFAWKMKDENNLRDIKWLSDLKLRLGYGLTGQQDGIGDYNYFAVYGVNTGTNNYYPVTGNGTLYRPTAYDANLTWETTTTYNIGLDFGFANNRLTGSADWYYRKTTDLLNTAYVAAGSNFRNQVTSNIGSLRNMGVEVALDWKVVRSKDWYWTVSYNFTYNHNKITDLSGGSDPDYKVLTGGISSGTSNTVQAHAVGHPASSFYVYQQAYDESGKPLEGVVVDRNGDGTITEDDKYFYKSPTAPVTMGLSSRLEYKNWDLGFSLRASLGNYVFNDFEADASNLSSNAICQNISGAFLTNRPTLVLEKNWQTWSWVCSDYFVHNASFLKCDNITLGYSFENLFKGANYHGISGRVYATASNVFTITNYNGIDPEVYGGIDNSVYPRPISFIVGLNLNF